MREIKDVVRASVSMETDRALGALIVAIAMGYFIRSHPADV
jgi:hypothetical protein